MYGTQSSERYIGLMSGTSMDGVDAVLVDFSSTKPKLLASHLHPYPSDLQNRIKACIQPDWSGSLRDFGLIHHQLGTLYADAVNQLLETANCPAESVAAVGSHGQTLWHHPEGEFPFTLQLGDASRVVELTGITTVADFRSRDVAAGGQGAPLLPAFLKELFENSKKERFVLNIGGIANLAYISPEGFTSGFDTGPGNGLLDAWIEARKGVHFDQSGEWASTGKVLQKLLNKCLEDPYFSLPPPKSTGKEYFNLGWLESRSGGHLEQWQDQDIQATLAELTAKSIADAILTTSAVNTASPQNPPQLLVYGGGWKNTDLIQRLQSQLDGWIIQSTGTIGIDPDWMEAMAFAWLAKKALQGESSNLPDVTGANGDRILGAIYPR